ncbi:hypothetical protein K2Z83_24135 [Oscillochloris sp. ZM17-4]|uniref:hypothetical protein n=1 Tax=Oscillochloris sp. ZM17-4 TaxID=2866714 RepID=UPI001C730C5D|nr:hypothetical protein [Oscillochloris sp. ZM17-4]MBX0330750.1 hypothetical protein [Oscillochloris sp. ZM17-4]
MSERVDASAPRQRVGRRLGLTPYYRIGERGPGRLVLESLPDANRGPGYRIAAGGAALILAAALILISGLIANTQGAGFGVAALAAIVAGVLGSLGMRRAIGGYAAITTSNQIIADADDASLTFIQVSRVGKPRRQILAFDQVRAIRLRRRPLMVGSLLRQVRPIVALELVVGADIWVVDSAENGGDLQVVAAALQELIAESRNR